MLRGLNLSWYQKYKIYLRHTSKNKRNKRRFKLGVIFDFNDMFGTVLESLDEEDKLYVSMVSKKLYACVKKSRSCPIYYKFSESYFEKNYLNEKIYSIFTEFPNIYKYVLTEDIVRKYCICKPMLNTSYFPSTCFCEFYNCVPCKILRARREECSNPLILEGSHQFHYMEGGISTIRRGYYIVTSKKNRPKLRLETELEFSKRARIKTKKKRYAKQIIKAKHQYVEPARMKTPCKRNYR
ncbi:MAG: hypothetical protein Hyperionvirus6_23 [Hyperionvirus sp.]|uniref:F-box domain-containing protein n=1 Tax=Hyperionvirus sp. TaxID=2487770 RepID=A0A3G5A8E2_9VIRU|nr:MAG: hypothetical protein Hyperionvirus6_23 [Hyperionvirus sp.]